MCMRVCVWVSLMLIVIERRFLSCLIVCWTHSLLLGEDNQLTEYTHKYIFVGTSPVCLNCIDPTWLVSCECISMGESCQTYISTVEHLHWEGRGRIIFFMEQHCFIWNVCSSLFLMRHVFIWFEVLAAALPRILLFWDVTLCCWVSDSWHPVQEDVFGLFDPEYWGCISDVEPPTQQHSIEVKKILILKQSCCQCVQT